MFRQMIVERGISTTVVDRLVNCLERLNKAIAEDTANLGSGYQVGHSYFCQEPPEGVAPANWMQGIIDTELAPLLREYWVDDPGLAERWAAELDGALGNS